MTDEAPVAAATPDPEALPAATPAPEAPVPPPSPPPSKAKDKGADAFRSAADIKAWVRAEIDLAQCGLSEDERKARNP